jgi:hypothetical protein
MNSSNWCPMSYDESLEFLRQTLKNKRENTHLLMDFCNRFYPNCWSMIQGHPESYSNTMQGWSIGFDRSIWMANGINLFECELIHFKEQKIGYPNGSYHIADFYIAKSEVERCARYFSMLAFI